MVRRLKEGYQDESFVAYYNGELFYTGQLDSNFSDAVQKLIRKDADAYKSVCDYLKDGGVEDFDCEDDFNISYLLSKLMYYEAVDGEDYWNFDEFEIFPEYELDESIKRNESFRMRESKGKKCYVVVELESAREPKIIGVFLNKQHAEKVAYEDTNKWRNIIETTMQ